MYVHIFLMDIIKSRAWSLSCHCGSAFGVTLWRLDAIHFFSPGPDGLCTRFLQAPSSPDVWHNSAQCRGGSDRHSPGLAKERLVCIPDANGVWDSILAFAMDGPPISALTIERDLVSSRPVPSQLNSWRWSGDPSRVQALPKQFRHFTCLPQEVV